MADIVTPRGNKNGGKAKAYKKRIATKRENIEEALDKYVEEHENPYLIGFILEYGMCKSYFSQLMNEKDSEGNYVNEDLRAIHDRLMMKRELYIVDGALTGKLKENFSKFLLKQPAFGYLDQVVVKNETEDKNSTGIVEIPAVIIDEGDDNE